MVSKEQKTSEFRQAWIDALRNDLAIYLSRINSAYDAAVADFESTAELWKNVREDVVSMTEASTRMRLRLNHKEEYSDAILRTIKRIDKLFSPSIQPTKPQELDDLQHQLVSQAAIVLKAEWKRVKSGEPIFMWAKSISLSVLCMALLVIVWMVVPTLKVQIGHLL